jgi:hypothetical protein
VARLDLLGQARDLGVAVDGRLQDDTLEDVDAPPCPLIEVPRT